jgi:hypothetical protein
MNSFALADFTAGLIVAGYLVAALTFARFYRDSRDRLFLWFSAGFVLLAAQRASLAAADVLPLDPLWYYVIRLIAFLLFLGAIIDKNRPRG